MGPWFWSFAKEHDKNMIYKNMEYSYNFSTSKDHQPYLQDSTPPGISLHLGLLIQPIPHRTLVALFWDLFGGLHMTSWQWMASRRTNYPHDQLEHYKMSNENCKHHENRGEVDGRSSLYIHWWQCDILLCKSPTSVSSKITFLNQSLRKN